MAHFVVVPVPFPLLIEGGLGGGKRREERRRRPTPFFASVSAPSLPPQSQASAAATAAVDASATLIQGAAPDTFRLGDVLGGGRFTLRSKIYDGRFATVWRADDAARGAGAVAVLKLPEAGDAPTYAAGAREAAAHAAASGHPNVVELLARFEHRSPAGRHACLAMEPLGDSLAAAAAEAAGGLGLGLPLPAVRSAARQALAALDHVHARARLAHMAVTPANLLLDAPFRSAAAATATATTGPGNCGLGWLRRAAASARDAIGARLGWPATGGGAEEPQQQQQQGGGGGGKDDHSQQQQQRRRPQFYSEADLATTAVVKLADFGRSLPLDRLDGPQGREPLVIFADPAYRPPEELLGLEYRGPAYDMWGLGCTLFALATGSELFSPAAPPALAGGGGPEAFDANDGHLAQMVALFGPLPRKMVDASPLKRLYFLPSGRPRVQAAYDIPRRPLALVLREDHGLGAREAERFAAFLTPLLDPLPERRPSAAKMLQHRWLRERDADEAELGKEEQEQLLQRQQEQQQQDGRKGSKP